MNDEEAEAILLFADDAGIKDLTKARLIFNTSDAQVRDFYRKKAVRSIKEENQNDQ